MEETLSTLLDSSSFSVAEYLNTALEVESSSAADNGNSNELQRKMAELALQLQLQTQSCHEDIGRIGAELQAVLPRCSADVGRVGVGLQGLKMDCESLLHSSAFDRNDVSSSLETLSTLHALQANLTKTKEILTAAATWDASLHSVTTYMAQSNLAEAVSCLANLEKGERALRGMPNPEERVNAIGKVRQQVGTLLQPQLKHALAVLHTRLGPLQQCVELYTQLSQMHTLVAEYVKHRPAAIHKLWFEYTPAVPGNNSNNDSSDASTETGVDPFGSWLPVWFDAVLTLVSEERRQCTSIFGSDMVPEITIQIFKECFRPILPSFKSRLHSIYSPELSGPKTGSLQSISYIYESMLQFLSLSYESIIGGWLDIIDAGAASVHGPKLNEELMGVFALVASPFREYQLNLSGLESKYLGRQTQELAKEIQQVTTSVSGADTSLEVLQNTVDRLLDLSATVFPLAESAVARFELLNGGYFVTNAISTIDALLTGHAGELAIAIHKLSAAMNSDDKVLAEKFDEPHVLCTLGVLKIAGSFRRYVRLLESKSRDRLGVLSDRMSTHVLREKQLQKASEKAASGIKSSFQLSDSMSAVEIDSLLTTALCVSGDDGALTAALETLQELTHQDDNLRSLFPKSQEASKRLATSCHTFVFNVCSSVPRLHLSGVASMTAWKDPSSADLTSYGTLPQDYITQIGEHMLALVQALEPFASDKEALSLANEVMNGVCQVAQQPWLDFIAATGSLGSESMALALMEGKELQAFVLGGAALDEEDETEEDEEESSKAVTTFCNAWLDVVGSSVTGKLLERIMRIPLLTTQGCEHLNADLGYLVNVFSALGLAGHPHPLIGHISVLATADQDLLSNRAASADLPPFLQAVEVRLQAMKTTT